jgi:hypothetical protein
LIAEAIPIYNASGKFINPGFYDFSYFVLTAATEDLYQMQKMRFMAKLLYAILK